MRILIVDDDLDLCETLKQKLSKTLAVDVANTAEDGLYFTQLNDYQVLILDITLPDMDGVELCRTLRSGGVTRPILMLTGQADVNYKVRAMETGADDYLTKPFDFSELLARVKALDRRINNNSPTPILNYGEIDVNTSKRLVFVSSAPLNLSRREYDLFECLFKNRGKVLNRDFISQYVWENNLDVDLKVISVHVASIKRKLQKLAKKDYIKSVYGIGYIFE